MELQETFERMHDGRLYYCDQPELVEEQMHYLDKIFAYNQLKPSMRKEKEALLKEMFAELGEGCYIETPFTANWGGKHVHFGTGVYANYNLTLVDDTHIYVGDHVMIGPNVTLATAGHPVEPQLRKKQVQFNLPIHIGNNAWIGAGTIVLPGVTIGENTVIGAGSVVTKDMPANVVAVGNPCRVLREISDRNREYYYRDRRIDLGDAQYDKK